MNKPTALLLTLAALVAAGTLRAAEPTLGAAGSLSAGAATPEPSSDWTRQAFEDSVLDSSTVVFDGKSPNRLACNTNLRKMPDGTLAMMMLGGGDSEPLPENNIFLTWSRDHSPQRRLWLGHGLSDLRCALGWEDRGLLLDQDRS